MASPFVNILGQSYTMPIGNLRGADPRAMAALQAMQGLFGSQLSVLRGASANLGGSHGYEHGKSDHDRGMAFDIDTMGWTNAQKIKALDAAKQAGFYDFGLDDKTGDMHVGMYGAPRAWTYSGPGAPGIGGSHAIVKGYGTWGGIPLTDVQRDIVSNSKKPLPAVWAAGGVPSAGAAPRQPANIASSNTPTLRTGMTGPAVRELQSNLTAAGFNPGGIDSIYGPRTARAVRAFETATPGLTRDAGIAGPQVLGALGDSANGVSDIMSALALQERGLGPPGGPPAGADMRQPGPPAATAVPPTFPSAWGEQPSPGSSAATKTIALGPSDYGAASQGSGEDNFARFMQQHAAPFTPAPNQMQTGRSKWTDLAGVSEPLLGMAQTSPDAFAAAQRASLPPPTFPAMFDRQTQPVDGPPTATASVPLPPPRPDGGPPAAPPPDSLAAAIQSGDMARTRALTKQFVKNFPPTANPVVPPSLYSSTPLADQRIALRTGAPGGVPFGAPSPDAMGLLGNPSAVGGPGDLPANAGSPQRPGGAPLSLDAISLLQDRARIPRGDMFAGSRYSGGPPGGAPLPPDAPGRPAFDSAFLPSDMGTLQTVGARAALAQAMAARAMPGVGAASGPVAPEPGSIGAIWNDVQRNIFDPASGAIGNASRWTRQQLGIDPPAAPPGPQSYNSPAGLGTSLLTQMLGITPAYGAEPAGSPASDPGVGPGGRYALNWSPSASVTPAGGPPGIAGVTFGGMPPSGIPASFDAVTAAAAVRPPIVSYRPPPAPRSAPPQAVSQLRNPGAGLSSPGYNPNFGMTNPQTQSYINNYLGYGGGPPGPTGNYGSPFTPSGWNAPNFNPTSGGSTYAYTYDPTTGQGSYINSQGQPISYSSF